MILSKWHGIIKSIRANETNESGFLDSRRKAESEARRLLDKRAGRFDKNDLIKFLNNCNTEVVPPDLYSTKYTRFQLSFNGQNRKLMLESLDAFNHWADRLWRPDCDPLSELSAFWQAPGHQAVKGAGSALPTMILYLRDPYRFNVWIPFLSDALTQLTGQKFLSKRTRDNYELYNQTINRELRAPFELEPQEIDYILYRCGQGICNGDAV